MTTYYDLKDASESCYEKADLIVEGAMRQYLRARISTNEYYHRHYQAQALQRTAKRLEKHASRMLAQNQMASFLLRFHSEKDIAADQLFADQWQAEIEAQQRDQNELHQLEQDLRGV